MRMQQEARENAVSSGTPPHSYVGFRLQPNLLILGEVNGETS